MKFVVKKSTNGEFRFNLVAGSARPEAERATQPAA